MGTPRTPTTFWRRPWGSQAQVGSSGFWAVFILCNDEREDEGRQGHTHSTCHGTGAPTPTVWRRTAAASVVRRHGNTSEPAWQRTAGAPLGAATTTSTQGFLSSNGHTSSAVAWRRLKAFSQHGAWSRRPSRRKLTVSSCRLRHRPRLLVLLQTRPRHQARGPRREHQGQAGERPPFSTLCARPYEHTFSRCVRAESQLLPQQGAGGWLPVADGGSRGPLPFKAKEFVSCYLSI